MTEGLRETDILIVGGGLCGLALAERLQRDGRDYLLVEARHRLGGRIKRAEVGGAAYDLGPAWFWPEQPRIAALADALGLTVFEQYASGAARFETANGEVHQGSGIGSMAGSLRIAGGMAALVDGLSGRLSTDRIITGATVTAIRQQDRRITVETDSGQHISATRVVLCLPPRLAARIDFSPTLPDDARRAMTAVPTWMAGHAKALVLYDDAFWRAKGLSGDAISQRGPLAEIHDASPHGAGPAALFGFLGIGPEQRGDANALTSAVVAQVSRLFGPDAPAPRDVVIKDWAFDSATATQADHAPLRAHPAYGMPDALRHLWHGKLIASGSELAPQTGGFLEGALEAAAAAMDQLSS